MNSNLDQLHPYPFEKLRLLFDGLTPPAEKSAIRLSVGEPGHPAPEFVRQTLIDNLNLLSNYPVSRGMVELREAIAVWLQRRFKLAAVNPETQVLPVSGTREALFAIAQATVSTNSNATVLCPNPFYQIYEGAALLAGAKPEFINCSQETDFLPDFDSVTADQWQRCQLLYLCNPGNPSGAVIPLTQLHALILLAREHDFVIASDECYAEIYADEAAPPPGLLEACEALEEGNFRNCLVFHSLSKRSNLPGLRSGFVAGDAQLINRFLLYRTYQGCAMPPHHQMASIAAWNDEQHVIENRRLYREKFAQVIAELKDDMDVSAPPASFYLWPKTPIADTEFAKALFAQEHVTVLPGRYLARDAGGINPGENRIRIALVAELADCVEAAQRIKHFLQQL
ncbi:MAG: N-succinyldiaminopimelate aminotransferase [Halieaceae bacterium]|jgi:N-succinyldiaminopimelate aminotransferase